MSSWVTRVSRRVVRPVRFGGVGAVRGYLDGVAWRPERETRKLKLTHDHGERGPGSELPKTVGEPGMEPGRPPGPRLDLLHPTQQMRSLHQAAWTTLGRRAEFLSFPTTARAWVSVVCALERA